MLLPSALPCDFLVAAAPTPLRRSSRSVTSPSPYHSPPREDSGLVSVTTTGLIQTCRRLQAILSVERLSSSPVTALAPAFQSGVRKNVRRNVTSAPPVETLKTPTRRIIGQSSRRISTPRRNKRSAAIAFPPGSPLSSDASDNSDKDYNCGRDRFTTPPPMNKRVRLTNTPPPAPNRGLRRLQSDDSEDEQMMTVEWTDEEDRQLVEMVLGKLNLSMGEWEECARNLGKKEGKSVVKRWEDLLGNISIREKRKRATARNVGKRRRN